MRIKPKPTFFCSIIIAPLFLCFNVFPSVFGDNANVGQVNILVSDLDTKTMANIIGVKLRSIDIEDHVLENGREIYLAVSDEIYKLLPKKVNGLVIKQYKGSREIRKNNVSYMGFRDWGRAGEFVDVTFTSYYVGGNISGCYNRYEKNPNKKWVLIYSDCFAGAT